MKNTELRKRLQEIREGDWGKVADLIDVLISDIVDDDEDAPRLGFATTRQLLAEISARIERKQSLDYRTVD